MKFKLVLLTLMFSLSSYSQVSVNPRPPDPSTYNTVEYICKSKKIKIKVLRFPVRDTLRFFYKLPDMGFLSSKRYSDEFSENSVKEVNDYLIFKGYSQDGLMVLKYNTIMPSESILNVYKKLNGNPYISSQVSCTKE